MNNYPGKLIVLYGINNLGKSTQAKLLVENLQKNGFKAEYIKFPIYDLSPSGDILNDYLREGNFYNLSPREAQLIYALNRTQYQQELINKLEAGINIIAEDYKGTGIAWGIGSNISEVFLKSINSHLLEEDLVFLFDGERFKNAIEKSHKHETDEDLMSKVRWAHLKLQEEYDWIKINANLAITEIQDIIWKTVTNFLKNGSLPENNNEKPASYNYSGFKAVGEIMNGKHKELMEKISNEVKMILDEKDNITIKNETNNKLPEEIFVDEKKTIEHKEDVQIKKLQVEKLNNNAKIPTKAHETDAGFDLFSSDYYSIAPYGQETVSTGIKISLPKNYAGLIWDKSGLAANGITTMGGVIDNGYRGEIKVVVKNLSEDMFNIIPGQKIAQLILQEIPSIDIEENKIDNNSDRGDNGFGSTGKF